MPQHEDSRPLKAWEVLGLEVNMHCGRWECKKKLDEATKIIKRCPGVNYITTVADEHKVIVSANEASANVLWKKLLETGKHTKSWLREVDQNLFLTDNGQLEENTFFSDRKIRFKMETLVVATRNFHDDHKVGEGGSATVYEGTHDGKQIAVKKVYPQGKKQFLNEVKLLEKMYHRNLVNLLGWCEEGSESLIVCEYLLNKSLDKFLADADKLKELDWPTRFNIALGVSHGLFYIHEGTPVHIAHLDISPKNIFLDKYLNPKIGDFGVSKELPENETYVATETIAGTPGYMAPEYFQQGQVSVKADVYSYGVVIIELGTGKSIRNRSQGFLLEQVWSSYIQQKISQMIDPAIIVTCHREEASRCICIGLLCTQADSNLRPSMGRVHAMLSDRSMPVPPSTIPGYLKPDASITKSVSRRTMDP